MKASSIPRSATKFGFLMLYAWLMVHTAPLNAQQVQNIDRETAPDTLTDREYRDVDHPGLSPPFQQVPPPPRGSLMGQGPSSLPLPTFPIVKTPPSDNTLSSQDHEPDELLMLSKNMEEAIEAVKAFNSLQFQIKQRQQLKHLDKVLSVFRLPPGSNAKEQLRLASERLPQADLALNHRYQLQSARHQAAQRLIQFNPDSTTCLIDTHLGLIDTSVNTQHPALTNRPIELLLLARPPLAPASHGTAIAALWLGNTGAGFLPLMPDARLSVAAVFRQTERGPDTTTDLLLSGLDWLLGKDVQAINLALGGPENLLLKAALDKLLENNILLVAAAGNQGPEATPLYPATHQGVIAVTAVDAQNRIYQNANRGHQIDFAAPGVQVWSANDNGTAYHTGTSFAAPFALAVMLAEKQSGQETLEGTRANAIDLGPPGKDDIFGWGLVRWPDTCK